jgi:uncharacterized protein (TIGR02646 family)
LPSDVKNIIKQQLLVEQGGLCCYTGIRINDQKCHIEHFKPQCLCQNHEDVDYDNLLAAYPDDNTPCSFGAKAKGDWYHTQLLINPLRGDCETHFRFNQYGGIKPGNGQDEPAKETIRRLRLDDDSLTDLRKQAIVTALFHKGKLLSVAKLQNITQHYCERNSKQLFRPFCFVIIQAAQELLRKAERKRKSKQFNRHRG